MSYRSKVRKRVTTKDSPRGDFEVVHHRAFGEAAGAGTDAEAAILRERKAGGRHVIEDRRTVESHRDAGGGVVADLDRDANTVGVGIGGIDSDLGAVDPEVNADVPIATVVVGVEADGQAARRAVGEDAADRTVKRRVLEIHPAR